MDGRDLRQMNKAYDGCRADENRAICPRCKQLVGRKIGSSTDPRYESFNCIDCDFGTSFKEDKTRQEPNHKYFIVEPKYFDRNGKYFN